MQINMLIQVLLSVTVCWVGTHAAPAPQDFQKTALTMANQMKEMVENGVATAGEQIQFMSSKVNDAVAVGYGEVMKMPAGGRRKREIDSQALGAGNSMSAESDYSNESDLIYSGESLSDEQRKKTGRGTR
ncbi:PREDICTED: uncharacterized protein LOC108372750 [Rhagoletis zephyria]|uniref:uncharacterized protein LOC108372750 n=1 Tax=Rhagoletis zephyria TaxID=28612 RepID=UPI0008116DEA|nr:PREDICTED: uncharacterized protein LOC108372750 [Rhagoletis zephyria]